VFAPAAIEPRGGSGRVREGPGTGGEAVPMSPVACPHCGAACAPGPSVAGAALDCPACDRSFLAPAAAPASTPAPASVVGDSTAAPVPAEASSESARRSEAPFGLTGAVAAALTTVFYLAVVQPLSDTGFGQIFGARGWVPYVISFLSMWSAVLLAWKYRRLRAQSRVFAVDLLPGSLADRVTPAAAPRYLAHLASLPADLASGFLVQRMARTLEHFRVRADVAEAVDVLRAQAERDEAAVESSFSMLRVFIWAIPILGFIGTVLGIGQSVGGFSESVAAAADLDVMKDSIGTVTSGLGIAFDTTLLALVMSIFIMFPTSSLQKAEEDHLARVDDYCQRNLVARLDDGRTSEAGDDAWVDRVAGRLAERLLGALERRPGGTG
jgi:biopolymer transport protein ExbB/TolQ